MYSSLLFCNTGPVAGRLNRQEAALCQDKSGSSPLEAANHGQKGLLWDASLEGLSRGYLGIDGVLKDYMQGFCKPLVWVSS